jgi:hypothetical protein
MFLFIVFGSSSQELLDILESETLTIPKHTQATFKANRILLTHSIETRKKGTLEFVLGTRYWNIPNNDDSQSFGADRFSGHLGLQYALSDRFTIGAGVTSYDGIINGFAKYRLVRQTDDDKVPLSITLVQSSSLFTRDFAIFSLPQDSKNRLSYTTQLIIARKLSRNLSLQVSPAYIYSGVDQPVANKNNFFALGFAGRYKLSNHVTIASEYNYLLGRDEGEDGFNLFSLGINWEISDLIMQFSMTNSKGFDDVSIFTLNPNNFHFRPGGLHIGVNATYVLHLKKRKPKVLE